jgi:catechol 2,3-dioxygenase-like lactoylglutathione lyase family enzyme
MSAVRGPAIHSVNRFVYSVPDLAEAEKFYAAFGLECRRHGKTLDLHTFGNPHCWATLHESGKPKKLEYLSFGIFAEDEKKFAEKITAGKPHPLSDGKGLWTRNPDGVAVQLVVAPKVSPSAKSQPLAEAAPPPGKGAAPSRSRVQQVRPRRLSHVVFFTPDVPRMVQWCEGVLGLRLSDRSLDVVAFMHGAHGSDHHLVAFARSAAPGLHHSSWDVGSVDEVGRGSEQMRNAGYAQGWGVGRHVLGSNYFYYARDPWGSYAEYSFDIDYVPKGFDWPAADHPPEDSFYVWGPAVPEDFICNFEAA